MEFAPICIRNIRDEIQALDINLKYLGENFFQEISLQTEGIEISLAKAVELKSTTWAKEFFYGSMIECDKITKMSLVQFCTSRGYKIKLQSSDFS